MLSSARFCSQSLFRQFFRISSLRQHATPLVPTFRQCLAKDKPFKSFSQVVPQPGIRNQILFATATSIALYAYAADQTNKDTEKWTAVARERGKMLINFGGPTNQDLRKYKKLHIVKEIQAGYDKFMTALQSWPTQLKVNVSWLFVQVAQPYLDANEGRRAAAGLVGLCFATWILWKLPKTIPFMRKSFLHDPLSGRSYTLLTSVFSHESFVHLAMNSIALTACGGSVWFCFYMSQEKAEHGLREADASWHCLAFFITAGLFASLTSHIVNARWVFARLVSKASTGLATAPRLASQLQTEAKAAARKGILPSLGISGAVYAGLVLTAISYPQAVASIMFLPIFPVPIQWLTGAFVAFDVICVVRGIQIFDHFAHLGGAFFGLLYYNYGLQWWNAWRLLLYRPGIAAQGKKKS
ncbi:hypothetical protein BC835DRAFT_1534856 [Cytidiella melzeri]|nr:hypothetical protein BC835DRAFT_1534856 [Cytidiella melzeri]